MGSFSIGWPQENCDLGGTDNFQGQIFKHIFAQNGGYYVYYLSNIFHNTCGFQNWEYQF